MVLDNTKKQHTTGAFVQRLHLMQDYLSLGLISVISVIAFFMAAGILARFRMTHTFLVSAGVISFGIYLWCLFLIKQGSSSGIPTDAFYNPTIILISIGIGTFFALMIVGTVYYLGGGKRQH